MNGEWRKIAAGEIFCNIYHSRIQINNELVNEIEIQEWRKPAASQFFHRICHSRTQINNEILNEIEIFDNICHSRTQKINEILNDIEIHEWRKPAAGVIFLRHFSQSYASN